MLNVVVLSVEAPLVFVSAGNAFKHVVGQRERVIGVGERRGGGVWINRGWLDPSLQMWPKNIDLRHVKTSPQEYIKNEKNVKF